MVKGVSKRSVRVSYMTAWQLWGGKGGGRGGKGGGKGVG